MNAKIFSMLTVVTLTLAGSPALADWQYTHWGMTPEEVLAAAPNPIGRPDKADFYDESANLAHLLTSTYSVGDLSFQVQFIFHDLESLAAVRLVPYMNNCTQLERILTDTYGAPERGDERRGDIRFLQWWDGQSENVVMYFVAFGDCSIMYREHGTPGAVGGL